MSISLENLYYHPEFCTEKVDINKPGMYIISGFNPPCMSLPKNYFEWPEAKIVAKYWDNDLTDKLKELVNRFGKKDWVVEFGMNNVREILGENKYEKMTEELKAEKGKYEKRGLWIHGYSTPPQYFAEALVCALKIPIPKFEQRICGLCKRTFIPLEGSSREKQWGYYPLLGAFSYKDMPYCYKCIKKTFRWPRPKPRSKKIALERLKKLYDTSGFIPSRGYLGEYFATGLIHIHNKKKLNKIMKALQILPDPEYYKHVSKSWFKVLIKADIITGEARKMARGTMLLAKDGHVCFSLGEKMIDDWLKKNKIKHEKETHYPKDNDLNPNGLWRTDWQINKIYIEYAGLRGQKEYDDKILLKKELALKKQLNLIILVPDDLPNLTNKLQFLK